MATSAGLCLWRWRAESIEVLIAHPGGPFWTKKDEGAWSFPKGEFDPESEDGYEAAQREFAEETGFEVPPGEPTDLGSTRLKSGKTILAWAVEGDLDADAIRSNLFEMEWPPRSGKQAQFPEIDRAMWADLETASVKLNPAQVTFVERLVALLNNELSP